MATALWLVVLFITLIIGALAGAFFGYNNRRGLARQVIEDAERKAQNIQKEAEQDAKRHLREVEEEGRETIQRERLRYEQEAERNRTLFDAEMERSRASLEQEVSRAREDITQEREDQREKRAELRRDREQVKTLEERLNRRAEQQDARASKLDELETSLTQREDELKDEQEALNNAQRNLEQELFDLAGLSKQQASDIIMAKMDKSLEREKAVRIREALDKADSESKRKSQTILAQAIQRSAAEVSAAISVTVVPIPSDNMKGRIIGREGRNIRAFEAITGVDLIIDDTPEAVLLSSFNPIRREVAKLALEELVADGRIHPARIEELVAKAQQEMQQYIRERGEEAALEANVIGLKPGMLQLLGRMHFRTSYGQNVLKHSVQVAHMTGIIAAEIGLDEKVARRAGLLHDIGKSIDREIEGTHTEIGSSLAKRFGEGDEVIDAIANHHDLSLAKTLFPIIVSAADAISAARPGARRESLESYLQRLEGLEEIASSFPGVEKSYAIQAGRELRIIVQPREVDDSSAVMLARDVANRIEQDMEYPGQVQVTVVRESRAVEYAR